MLDPAWTKVQNLLLARLDNIGDLVMCTPAFRTVRAELPRAHITLMASPGGGRAASLIPYVDDVLIKRVVWQDLGHMPYDPAREWQLIRALAEAHYDGAIVFTSFSQSPYPPGFAFGLAGIPLRAGQSGEDCPGLLTHFVEPPPYETHQVDRNLHLVEALGFRGQGTQMTIRIPDAARASLSTKLRAWGWTEDVQYAVLHPGASCPSRIYPVDRFEDVAARLVRRSPLVVFVTGDNKEVDLARRVAGGSDRVVAVAGETNLEELAALIEGAALVITNNTGTMHLADAVMAPTVVLFAGTELARQWTPRHAPCRVLQRLVHCSPCHLFSCPTQLECLDVEPDEVVEIGLELFSSCRGRP